MSEITETRSLIVGEPDRIDRFLARALAPLSRTRIKALIEEGHAAIDGAPTRDASAMLRGGETVTLGIPAPKPAEPVGQDIALDIVYEDGDLLVIDKPAGLVVHPAGGHEDGTLVNALIAHCGDSLSGIGGVRRPGIVHRLDKDTSGVMVVAKNDLAHRALAAQFADHGRTGPLERAYRALVWGVPQLQARISAPIERSTRNREKMAVTRPGRGREAVTHAARLAVYGGEDGEALASLLECRLETGRTHQIRVHMAHAGHPLLGDALYGAGFRTKAARLHPEAREALERLGRQALHARLLAFAHPRTGETMRFERPEPADMAALIAALRPA